MGDENTIAVKKVSRFRMNQISMYGGKELKNPVVLDAEVVPNEQQRAPERSAEERRELPFDPSENYGRWARRDEVVSRMTPVPFREVGGIGKAGVPLWYEGGNAYLETSDSHTLIIGSTGSRKTRCCIAPILKMMARSNESVVVTDPKGELLNMTYSDFIENGYDVKVIDLRRTDCSDRWSPLRVPYNLMKSKNSNDVARGRSYLRELAADMIPVQSLKDPYWENTAQRGLYALMCSLIDTARKPSEVNFQNLVKMVNDIFSSDSNMSRFLSTYKGNDPEYVALQPIITNAPNTRACILSMMYQGLSVFTSDESVVDMLSDSSFDMADLGRRKMALFMTLPDENTGLNALASTMISQLYGSLISLAQSEEGAKVLPVRVNFVLDEFANLPPVNGMASMITASRGRNMRFILAIQDMFQMTQRYGMDGNTLASNCSNWIYLYSRQMDFLNELSDMVGRDRDGRPLITPAKLMNLDAEKCEALVISGRTRPFLTSLKDISEYTNTEVNYPAVPRRYKKPVLFDLMKLRCKRSTDDDLLKELFE